MDIIYTFKNPENNKAYVWYTGSLSTRIQQHVKKWLFLTLWLPVLPVWVLVKTWQLIIDTFLSTNKREDERKQIARMKDRDLLNRTKWGNGS